MNTNKAVTRFVAFSLALGVVGSAFAMGDYVRKGKKGNQIITVANKGGKLFCTRQSDGFELCHGMTQDGANWSGKKMKHPDMPGFMTFNGTVTISANTVKIKGCAVGKSMCDEEVWTKQ